MQRSDVQERGHPPPSRRVRPGRRSRLARAGAKDPEGCGPRKPCLEHRGRGDLAPLHRHRRGERGALARRPREAERAFDLRAPILARMRSARARRSWRRWRAARPRCSSISPPWPTAPIGWRTCWRMCSRTSPHRARRRRTGRGRRRAVVVSGEGLPGRASGVPPRSDRGAPGRSRDHSSRGDGLGGRPRRVSSGLHPRASLFLADGTAAHERGATRRSNSPSRSRAGWPTPRRWSRRGSPWTTRSRASFSRWPSTRSR